LACVAPGGEESSDLIFRQICTIVFDDARRDGRVCGKCYCLFQIEGCLDGATATREDSSTVKSLKRNQAPVAVLWTFRTIDTVGEDFGL